MDSQDVTLKELAREAAEKIHKKAQETGKDKELILKEYLAFIKKNLC